MPFDPLSSTRFSHGYINVTQHQGRKIFAAFSFDNQDGRRIVLVTEHVLFESEQRQGINPNDYPLTFAARSLFGVTPDSPHRAPVAPSFRFT